MTFHLRRRDLAIGRLPILGLSVFLLGYEAVRAARVALTGDEARTFFEYIAPGPLAFFKLDTVNNHFLNSLLAKASSLLAGTSGLALRPPTSWASPLLLFTQKELRSRLLIARPWGQLRSLCWYR